MKNILAKACLLSVAFCAAGVASADSSFGIGAKVGTLGIGIEAIWRPVPFVDFRVGANAYDYTYDGLQAGLDYSGTLSLETVYATGNFHFPISPFRITAGLFSNGNEIDLTSVDSATFDIGGTTYTLADVGSLTSVVSFEDTAPYLGIGFDFTVLDKVGMNLDMGVLWQDEPVVTMQASGLLANDPTFLAAAELERQQLADDMSSFKAYPVVSLGFVFNF
jgi:hypothetical protein